MSENYRLERKKKLQTGRWCIGFLHRHFESLGKTLSKDGMSWWLKKHIILKKKFFAKNEKKWFNDLTKKNNEKNFTKRLFCNKVKSFG